MIDAPGGFDQSGFQSYLAKRSFNEQLISSYIKVVARYFRTSRVEKRLPSIAQLNDFVYQLSREYELSAAQMSVSIKGLELYFSDFKNTIAKLDTQVSDPAVALAKFEEVAGLMHLSRATVKSYRMWIKRYVRLFPDNFTDKNCINGFISKMADRDQYSPQTQKLALNAIVFFFRHILTLEVGSLKGIQFSKMPPKLPEVLSKDEVLRIFEKANPQDRLMFQLLYGTGIRLRPTV